MDTFVVGAINALIEGGFDGYVVGGAVRDGLLGYESADLDIAVSSDSSIAANVVSDSTGGRLIALDPDRGHYRINRSLDAASGAHAGQYRE